MSGGVTYQLTGFKELGADLKQLPVELGPAKILKKAVAAGAPPIVNDAKSRCPVDHGNLRDSITFQMGRASLEKGLTDDYAATVLIGTACGTGTAAMKKQEALGVDVNPYYGKFVELGTRFERPQPFLGPAFDMNIDTSLNEISNELGYQIDQYWSKTTVSAA